MSKPKSLIKTRRGEGEKVCNLFLQNIPQLTHAAFKSRCYAQQRTMRDILILMMQSYAAGKYSPTDQFQKLKT